jgi:exopolyphosphatase/guanosine-5'-triphosphate,3'-diphosphate pyrophosphatase
LIRFSLRICPRSPSFGSSMIAILDFGTNTFNLLIAQRKERGFEIVHTSKQPAKLGKGGIQANRITPDAFERGFVAINNHMETIQRFGVEEIRAFATSAIRNASNGRQFVEEVEKRFGFRVRVIPGEREAELIYKGVRQAVRFTRQKVLILDIGGGSNEFILCNRDGIIWKHSFELGMARIIELFSLSDPITHEEIHALEDYYMRELEPLFALVQRERPRILIGASGSFDTFYAMIRHRSGMVADEGFGREISMTEFRKIHRLLLRSTVEERKAMPGMEPVRVEMVVAAVIFVSFVIRECHILHLVHSEFALKEGVMAELVGL